MVRADHSVLSFCSWGTIAGVSEPGFEYKKEREAEDVIPASLAIRHFIERNLTTACR